MFRITRPPLSVFTAFSSHQANSTQIGINFRFLCPKLYYEISGQYISKNPFISTHQYKGKQQFGELLSQGIFQHPWRHNSTVCRLHDMPILAKPEMCRKLPFPTTCKPQNQRTLSTGSTERRLLFRALHFYHHSMSTSVYMHYMAKHLTFTPICTRSKPIKTETAAPLLGGMDSLYIKDVPSLHSLFWVQSKKRKSVVKH